MAVLHFFLVNSTLIYILFSLAGTLYFTARRQYIAEQKIRALLKSLHYNSLIKGDIYSLYV